MPGIEIAESEHYDERESSDLSDKSHHRTVKAVLIGAPVFFAQTGGSK